MDWGVEWGDRVSCVTMGGGGGGVVELVETLKVTPPNTHIHAHTLPV